MTTTYYHVTPFDNYQTILSTGLRPSPAHECDCGSGVHLAESVDTAHGWIARLREERDDLYFADFAILSVTVPEDVLIVEDQHLAHDLRGFIACTETPLSPKNIGLYERF